MSITLLVAGIVGFIGSLILLVAGWIFKENFRAGWIALVSIGVLLLGFILLAYDLKGLEKTNEAVPEPPADAPPLTEQFEEAMVLKDGDSRNTMAFLSSLEVEGALIRQSKDEWPGDSVMQEHYMEDQLEAFSKLSAFEITEPWEEQLLDNAIKEKKNDLREINYEFNNQLTAYNEIQQMELTELEKQFVAMGKSKYGEDYVMVQYELNTQKETYEWLEAQVLDTDKKRRSMEEASLNNGIDYDTIRFLYERSLKDSH